MSLPLPFDPPPGPEQRAFTVSELTAAIKQLLEGELGTVTVVGEVRESKVAASGHVYFTLTDQRANLAAVLFRGQRRPGTVEPAEGLQVEATGELTVYPPRGSYQLIVRRLAAVGAGEAQRLRQELLRRLTAEGLLAVERKRPLPRFPSAIGVVTSASGAALRDILSVLGQRFPLPPVYLFPTLVQGPQAPAALCAALRLVERHHARLGVPVVIIGRGGGGAEDLAAFDDEQVVRQAARLSLPVVSAVGHETDVSLLDLVADRRAATPSAAAEAVVPDRRELAARIRADRLRACRGARRQLREAGLRLGLLRRRLGEPRQALALRRERLRSIGQRLRRALEILLAVRQRRLDELRAQLEARHPRARLAQQRERLGALQRLHQALMAATLAARRRALAGLGARLTALSPLGVLERGYAVLLDPHGHALRDAALVAPGQALEAVLHQGRLGCKVDWIRVAGPVVFRRGPQQE